MSRILIAVLCVMALWPAGLSAQGRFGGRRGGFRAGGVIRMGVAPRGVTLARRVLPSIGYGGYFYAPFTGAPYSLPAATVFQPYGYPSFTYTVPTYTAPLPTPAYTYRSSGAEEFNALLYEEVRELRREVQRLREENEQLRPPPQTSVQEPAPQVPEEPSVPVVLVFRDGRQLEVPGYAIVGQTLWALTEQTSTQFPLSDLDLETTRRTNTERGVRFPLPR